MVYELTRPDADQLKFKSNKTGDWVLDAYLESAELGNQTLAQLLLQIFSPEGTVLPTPVAYVPLSSVFFENDQVVASNYSVTNGKNAMSAGPITVNVGVTVTVPSGSTWSIV